MTFYRFLADVVLVVHGGFVLFVIAGLVLTLVGWPLRWRWERNFYFRLAHLVAIVIVVGQAWGGVMCPLTTWESDLRIKAGQVPYDKSFMQDWVGDLLFYSGPPWVFTLCYTLFGIAVLVTFIFIRPRWPWRRAAQT